VKRDALRVEGGDFEITFASAPALEDPQKASPEVFPIRAPAFVQGPVSEVEVMQARAQLVAE